MMTHRNHFINQLDPEKQEANFSIGQEIIWSLGGNLPRVRQDYELSARYYDQRKTSQCGAGGNTTSNSSRQMIQLQDIRNNPNNNQHAGQMAASSNEAFTSDGGCLRKGDKKGQKLSVRYTENPGN